MSGRDEVSSKIIRDTLMMMFLTQESEADLVWTHLPPAVPGPGAEECGLLPGLQTGNNLRKCSGLYQENVLCPAHLEFKDGKK